MIKIQLIIMCQATHLLIHTYTCLENNWKIKVIHCEKFIVKEIRRDNVSVLINHHEGFKNDTKSW